MKPAHKPFSPSCERIREPILALLQEYFQELTTVLEIGSGTGQHAVYFAEALPHLTWQTSDRTENLPTINAWLDDCRLPNTPMPLELDVNEAWPSQRFDAVFTANTLHILSWSEVESLFTHLADVMADLAKLVIYGPLNYGGRFTSDSNAQFDLWLKARGSHQGIRDFEAVVELASRIELCLIEDRAMPNNNRCLVWQRGR